MGYEFEAADNAVVFLGDAWKEGHNAAEVTQ